MSGSQNVTYQTLVGQISAMNEFTFPAQYLANQRYSYNQHLSFDLGNDLRLFSQKSNTGRTWVRA